MLHDETTNNKLLVLFLLDKLEIAISEQLLLEICSIENVWMPYFCCSQVLGELKEAKFIKYSKADGESDLLSLTSNGRQCLSAFFTDIPLSQRDDVTEFVKNKRVDYRKKQEFMADYRHNEDGTFTVRLKIMEIANPMLDLKMTVESKALATDITAKWSKVAAEAYRGLCDLLIEQ
ncbi:MAG: DUF4364 family protein [Bacillota bacterium]